MNQYDGILLIGSHALGTTFTIRATIVGSTVTTEGGLGNDSFNVGSPLTSLPGNTGDTGDLDDIQGLLTIVGGGGADNLEVDDHGATGAFNYIVTPTTVLSDPSTQANRAQSEHAAVRGPSPASAMTTPAIALADTVTTLRARRHRPGQRFSV